MGAPRFEFIDRNCHDSVQIFGLKRDDFERDVESFTHRTRVAKIFLPRAVTQVGQFVFQPDFQVEGRNIVTAFVSQFQGYRAVDTT